MQTDIFRPSERRISLSLVFASVFAVMLLLLRILLTERTTYAFLLWNLFLAWIPLVCAWMVGHVKRFPSRWKLVWIPAFLWLLFFPNSPYILTDLGHLARISEWATAPLGYDVVMLLSFALNGLFLGFVSLFIMERIWKEYLPSRVAMAISIFCLFLAGFGMYLGRFLRWNSWDLFHQPWIIIRDALIPALYPLSHLRTWGFTFLYASFLIAIYLVIHASRSSETK